MQMLYCKKQLQCFQLSAGSQGLVLCTHSLQRDSELGLIELQELTEINPQEC